MGLTLLNLKVFQNLQMRCVIGFICIIGFLAVLSLFSVVDAQLRLNHAQALATHNSFHLLHNPTYYEWNYTWPAISVQLDQGARWLEFDFHFEGASAPFKVQHIAVYDDESLCDTLEECLSYVKEWSLQHPKHFPIFIMIQQRSMVLTAQDWDVFDQKLLSVFPRQSILAPDDVRGSSNSSLREHIMTNGWPTIDEARGKVVFCLYEEQGRTDQYHTVSHQNLEGRLAFILRTIKDAEKPDAVILSVDDPVPYADNITWLVEQNILCRVRADILYREGHAATSEEAKMADIFPVIDVDSNGYISGTEAAAFFQAVGTPIPQNVINFLIGFCAANPTTGLNLTEWFCAVEAAKTGGGPGCMLMCHSNSHHTVPEIQTEAEVRNQREVALTSGAHFIATDYAFPPFEGASPDEYYWVEIPGGKPLRCNPVSTQGIACQPSEIEDLSQTPTTAETTTMTTETCKAEISSSFDRASKVLVFPIVILFALHFQL